ncbi:MAG: B12-binding domain-containing radical SAM protein [Thermoplasmata archaeon]|nr:MAG: B12-binding domain-containing radical SAM protein [Thermoplasmata archaeon]
MRIHFVFLDMDNMENPRGDVHFGLASLSAVLKDGGHEVNLTHLKANDRNGYIEKTISDIKKYQPDIIGFTLTELEERNFMNLSNSLKDEFNLPIMVGGAYPTIAPERIIKTKGVDMVVRGEGENVLIKLFENMEKKKPINEIRGVWLKENGRIYKNELDYPPDITKLPLMDFSIFDDEAMLGGELDGLIRFGYLCNRGCPFKCSYCLNYHLRHSYPDGSRYVRYQKIDRIIEHLLYLKSKYKFGLFNFYDDTFLLNSKWVEEFSTKYKRELDVPFICHARPGTSTKEMISMINKAGCKYLSIGLESGNESLRKNVLNRQPTNAQIITTFSNANEFDIKSIAFNMVGIPYETEKNILETIRVNAKVKPFIVGVSAFYPFRGTQLGDLCYDEGWVLEEKKEKVKSFMEGSILNYPQLSNKMINWYFKNFILLYYSKIDTKIFVKEITSRLFKRLHIHGRLGFQRKMDEIRTDN